MQVQTYEEKEQSEIQNGKISLSWLLLTAVALFIIGMVTPVLMYVKPAFGELDRGEVETAVIPDATFRSTPRKDISGESVIKMLKDKGLYDSNWNSSVSGFTNDYKSQNDGKVVFDRASGLMWQQSGSAKDISFAEAGKYVAKLNSNQYAGYHDWRLPTLEEAMSLLEETEKSGGLHIGSEFDNRQGWIWTADRNNVFLSWLVNFITGSCYTYVNDYFDFTSGGYVRAVR